MLESALRYSHKLIREIVNNGDTVVDATMGNGNDTALFASLVGETGCVHAFDVQELAVENTKIRLKEQQLTAQLHLESHENVGNYLQHNLKCAVFNLGYLPKSDKTIITQSESTLKSLKCMLTHLLSGGRILLVLYYGHDGGEQEKEAVLHFARTLPQEEYQVLEYQFINQKNSPPILVCIEKRMKE
ncbi:Putative rRNA methylase [Pilibacter termitis]|uniref:Putative rRNA methylase n=1 Tax=Pilibacter termitis TaxID=263852 RepID=A0A1T4K261_9ENTE|nr:class I SAM-dependent methyltransferase [Pilibacter termitis]SJZ36453.1 Putative rRNA methylase [Pilibacter termitis]